MRNLRAVLLLLSATLAPVLSQGVRTQITVDWIYSPAPHAISAMPETRWLADGRLLLAENGRLEVLDPVSLERGPFLDGRAATRSLRQVTGLPFQSMPDLEELSENGARALWNFEGSLVAMDLSTLVATRITDGVEGDTNARLSPDGSRVAFNRGSDLYAYTFATETLTRLTTDGSDTIKNGTLPWVYWEEIYGRQDLGFFWSPDSKHLAYFRSDESLVTELAHLDFRGSVPEIHRQRYPKAGTSNPVVRLGLVDLESLPAKTRWVELGGNSYEYLVRVKWLPTSDRLSAQTLDRAHQNLDLWFIDVTTGVGTKILSESDEGWINIHDDLDFLPDNQHFLWVSERTGYSHLYRYRMDGTLVNAVTSGEWAMKGASPIFWLRRAVAGIDHEAGYVY
ncbi:MAG TPA: DPP IV N-terminal domain-containing protein, partial [Planctomycetota bacterium]|nr:DPP IV N-terminal domain-containing protein [Planctomycetota bacterium]